MVFREHQIIIISMTALRFISIISRLWPDRTPDDKITLLDMGRAYQKLPSKKHLKLVVHAR